MATKSRKKAWIAKGFKWKNATNSIDPTDNRPIDIEEEPCSVIFQGNKKAYGRPIDANMSIHLIKAFLDRLDKAGVDLGELFLSKKRSVPIPENPAHIKLLLDTLVELLRQSMGMTYDKNIILKILSQPTCEGMRFYLCEKRKNKKPFISLVLVGVDKDGADLHYKKGKGVRKQNVPTTSLTGEYGHPPENKFLRGIPEEMALLLLAQDL